ncbi:MAG: hydantoinase/oxoprolinase family protein [Proteobacteria bacterium]|nr:hydantoinase/oxoprolinase family protein [Pseudomonadota bacterium]
MAQPVTHDLRVAADIGGTFTDIALIGDDGTIATRKVPSTPSNYADAVIRGIDELMAELKHSKSRIAEVLHGCTIATNTIVEHKGAKTALITTKGFRDVLELRRIRVPRLYEPLYVKPQPLVPRRLRLEVTERIGPRGEVVTPLDLASVHQAVERLKAERIEAVAVCLLHSYANAEHERRIGEILRRELKGVFISLSVDVLPQMREYERTSTTVINSYVGPPVKAYLRSLMDQLAKGGVTGRLRVMQSSGGILSAEAVVDRPAQIVECGPAAGVIGAAKLGTASGYDNLISFDMGGTTAKASIIEKGRMLNSDEYEVGGGISASSPLMKGGGYALKLPVIDIAEVGAGGGSIVWLDKAMSIKVGPQSAGAVPGPACYLGGGAEPTVTDANVVLGFLNREALCGGTVPIEEKRSQAALLERIARPLGRDLKETAYGIHLVANANMMRAVKGVTTYRGRDPRDFSLYAFGGNGGVHGVELARSLQIPRVIVPPAAGVLSALGLLMANVELTLAQGLLSPTRAMDVERVEKIYRSLEDQIAQQLGYKRELISFRRSADLRYSGQAFELAVPVANRVLDAEALALLEQRFEEEHERTYGHAFRGTYACETVTLHVVGSVVPEGARAITGTKAPYRPSGRRRVYFGPATGERDTPILARSDLDQRPHPGPFIIEEYEGTTVVPPGSTAMLDKAGNIVIEIGRSA